MIQRKIYCDKLLKLKDKQIIKIITGIRRSGKSTLLDLYIEELKKLGVRNEQIIHINFEDIVVQHSITSALSLNDYVLERMSKDSMTYVFIDEIQLLPEFQRAIDSIFLKKNIDIYITGSNSTILSSELATLLSGRYIEIKILPLSFSEYKNAYPNLSNAELIKNYMHFGSFPFITQLDNDYENVSQYLDSLYNTVLIRDVVYNQGLIDISTLEQVIRFMAANIGSLTSNKKISDTMTSSGQKISTHTIGSYIQLLQNAYLFYSIKRYDIQGKEYLKSKEKYYIVDVALRKYLLGQKHLDYGHELENIIYLELIRRGFKVYIGNIGDYEVDFVAEKGNDIEYYQVSWSLQSEETLERELRPLRKIKDNNPKYIITMDNFMSGNNIDGIKILHATDFLLKNY